MNVRSLIATIATPYSRHTPFAAVKIGFLHSISASVRVLETQENGANLGGNKIRRVNPLLHVKTIKMKECYGGYKNNIGIKIRGVNVCKTRLGRYLKY